VVVYRPQDFDKVRILGGARYLDLETTIDFANGTEFDKGQSWWDPFIGLEWRPRQDKWEYYIEGDIGGGVEADFALVDDRLFVRVQELYRVLNGNDVR
jgi:hypothetical protein